MSCSEEEELEDEDFCWLLAVANDSSGVFTA